MKTCPNCEKSSLVKKKIPYKVYGIELGKFPAEECSSCGQVWFSEETAQKIENLEKEKGLFGLSKKSKISYSGNSLVIRIPKELAKFMNLKKEEPVTLYPDGRNKLIVEV